METQSSRQRREPWNKAKLVGQKAPFKPKEIWAIRIRLQMEERTRELALFNLGIDSKLRACDLTSMRVRDVCQGERVAARACVLQRKPNDQCNSRSRHRLARLSKPGSARLICRPRITCSRAVVETRHISALVSTPVSCTAGSSSSASITRPTEPIP
jgi:hypothetical protein